MQIDKNKVINKKTNPEWSFFLGEGGGGMGKEYPSILGLELSRFVGGPISFSSTEK